MVSCPQSKATVFSTDGDTLKRREGMIVQKGRAAPADRRDVVIEFCGGLLILSRFTAV